MFFIFGWGHQTVKEHGIPGIYHCGNCNNDKPWMLYSRRSWFTLFFIPIIPYASEHLLVCPVCNHGIKLDEQKFKELKAAAESNAQPANNTITQEEYTDRTNELPFAQNSGGATEADALAGKTETQINYLRQMREIEQEREAKKKSAEEAEK